MSEAKKPQDALIRDAIRIRLYRKGQQLMEHVFQHTPIRIGRLVDNDIVLPFDFVSRYHCELRFDGSQWVAIDLGSKNGLMLDPSTRAQEVRLDDGSEFQIQEVTLKLSVEHADDVSNFSALREAATIVGEADSFLDSNPSLSPAPSLYSRHESPRVGHRTPLIDVDQQKLLVQPHPQAHAAKVRAIQMVVFWHDVVIDVREFAVGDQLTWDWMGTSFSLGKVLADKTRVKVPRGCSSTEAEKGGLSVTLGEPKMFRASEVVRVFFRYVPKSRDLAPASLWPEQRLIDPLLVSSVVHGAAAMTTLFANPKHKAVEPNDEPRFAQIIVAPTPTQLAFQPIPTPTPPPLPSPTPMKQIAEREKEKPKPIPKNLQVKKTVENKKKREVALARKEDLGRKQVEKPEVKVLQPKVEQKEAPMLIAHEAKPAPAPTPVFEAKKVGVLAKLAALNVGAASNLANVEKIQVSRAPTSVSGSVTGREPVEGTGEIISKLNQSATGGGAGKGDGVTGVALGGKAAGGSYQMAGLSGKAGKQKIKGSVLGGATYTELSKNEGLTREQVMKVVQQHQSRIQACYEKSLMANPDLVGRAEFEWEITAKGLVTTVLVKEATVKNGEGLLECVKEVFAVMKFPEAKNGQNTTPTIGLPFGRL